MVIFRAIEWCVTKCAAILTENHQNYNWYSFERISTHIMHIIIIPQMKMLQTY